MKEKLNVLELFSGIGGMHVAVNETGIDYRIVGSYEISPDALSIYNSNFPEEDNIPPRNIMRLKAADFDEFAVDLLVMSPPCQPFTRQGNKRDVEDSRCSPFIHILKTIEECITKPKSILVENVVGFETSAAHKCLTDLLTRLDYSYQEFLLTPSQFGIPNSRLRYYLLAKKKPSKFSLDTSHQINNNVPVCTCFNSELTDICSTCGKSLWSSVQKLTNLLPQEFHNSPSTLQPYLETSSGSDDYLVSDKTLAKFSSVFDMVNKNSKGSCCFTKGYGHYVRGTGSILQDDLSIDMDETYRKLTEVTDKDNILPLMSSLRLRYFKPKEILNLLCFPQSYNIPPLCSTRQAYKSLGNSINVFIVSLLLNLLLSEDILCIGDSGID